LIVPIQMFHNEVHVWTLLHHGDVEVVSLVGVYSTEAHPFGLVYEYMDGLDLKQYMKNEPNLRRLKLVRVPTLLIRCLSTPHLHRQQLIGIARGLKRMHDLGIVHGNLQSVRCPSLPHLWHTVYTRLIPKANILVDKEGTVRIAGLGNAIVLPHSTTYPLEGRTNTDRLSCGRAPELTWPGVSQSVADPIHPTKASDMYGFGVVAWEVRIAPFGVILLAHSRYVLTGKPPFSEMTEIAATYAMLSGARPLRQTHHEISDRLWYMIERCWYNLPLKRVSAGEAVQLLEAELGHAPNSRTLPHT